MYHGIQQNYLNYFFASISEKITSFLIIVYSSNNENLRFHWIDSREFFLVFIYVKPLKFDIIYDFQLFSCILAAQWKTMFLD